MNSNSRSNANHSPHLDRKASLHALQQREQPWDLLVIGGGATGVGVAMDAASRGLDVALVERLDFGSGTSSRSTKLVHGGVRYLEQGNITLVRDALRERTLLLQNAPHLVTDQAFLIPCESTWQTFFYGTGLKVYDLLAIGNPFGRSHRISGKEAQTRTPAVRKEQLKGGVIYHDGQFDDSRLLINMAQTASANGACLINYATVTALLKDDQGTVCGASVIDGESGQTLDIRARAVINAAGPFCDDVRRMDDADCQPMLAVSQGIHLVLPKKLFPGDTAMIVPKTADGRVIFIVPWHDHAIVGTTDTALERPVAEPRPQLDEIAFLLETATRYLTRPPTMDDVLSLFTGIRPLVKGDKSARTASLSRDHVIRISDAKLITISGGKWTTVRKMAEDCVDKAIRSASLPSSKCQTKNLPIHGAPSSTPQTGKPDHYGTDRQSIDELEKQHPEWAQAIHPDLAIRKSEIVWATRNEMARTLDDALARRTRALFLNSNAAVSIADEVALLMAAELGQDQAWCDAQKEAFMEIAEHYLPQNFPAESPATT